MRREGPPRPGSARGGRRRGAGVVRRWATPERTAQPKTARATAATATESQGADRWREPSKVPSQDSAVSTARWTISQTPTRSSRRSVARSAPRRSTRKSGSPPRTKGSASRRSCQPDQYTNSLATTKLTGAIHWTPGTRPRRSAASSGRSRSWTRKTATATAEAM
ncbi:hypothetical protein NKH77_02425 [Streptomyces sp. M19]